MITFDQLHAYQFSLFLAEGSETDPVVVQQLGALISRQVPHVQSLGLKLGQPEQGQSFVAQAGSLVPGGPTLTWKAGSGIWRVVHTASRLDVHFDARGYADLMDHVIPLDRVAERVVPNLVDLPKALGTVNRLALIVTGHSTCTGTVRPSRAVALTFFRDSLIEAEAREQLSDAVARTNHPVTWTLGEQSQVRVNRNETGTAAVVHRNGTEETDLAWQWDVNTSGFRPMTLGGANIEAFFRQSEGWISDRLRALLELR